MKLVKAYVRRYMLSHVIEALKELDVPRVAVVHIEAIYGEEVPEQPFQNEKGFDKDAGESYTKMIKLELVCDTRRARRVKKIILKVAKTGYKGDGLVVISPVEETVNIRTGKAAEG